MLTHTDTNPSICHVLIKRNSAGYCKLMELKGALTNILRHWSFP